MAPSGESFRNTFFFLRMVQPFYRRYLQNTTNNVTGTQEDHDRSRYAAYSVKNNAFGWECANVGTVFMCFRLYSLTMGSVTCIFLRRWFIVV